MGKEKSWGDMPIIFKFFNGLQNEGRTSVLSQNLENRTGTGNFFGQSLLLDSGPHFLLWSKDWHSTHAERVSPMIFRVSKVDGMKRLRLH